MPISSIEARGLLDRKVVLFCLDQQPATRLVAPVGDRSLQQQATRQDHAQGVRFIRALQVTVELVRNRPVPTLRTRAFNSSMVRSFDG
ncbi:MULTISPECIES: hypothetical protein [Pseudomonas]|uniref:hypothetical protein n=1 Tax=Pseudomonas TaxID=286 RepID=UPI0013DDF090|nr:MULTISPECIES: hypothetical protein [Pseudomonas]MDQ0980256.1 hypothetical protein [Pseudomonas synxantha]